MKYLFILLFLTGCTTSIPKIETKIVEVPILKTCHEGYIKPVKPILFTDTMKEDDKLDIVLNGALKDVNELKVYSEKLMIFICD